MMLPKIKLGHEPTLLLSSKRLSSRELDNSMNDVVFHQAGDGDRKTGERDIKRAMEYAK